MGERSLVVANVTLQRDLGASGGASDHLLAHGNEPVQSEPAPDAPTTGFARARKNLHLARAPTPQRVQRVTLQNFAHVVFMSL